MPCFGVVPLQANTRWSGRMSQWGRADSVSAGFSVCGKYARSVSTRHSHVVWCSLDTLCHRGCPALCQGSHRCADPPADAKVSQNWVTLITDEHILRLEVCYYYA